MSHYQDLRALDEQQLLNSRLRGQLGELKRYQAEYFRENEEVARLEQQYLRMLEDKEMTRKQIEYRVDKERAASEVLNSQIKDLQNELHRISAYIQKNEAENAQLREYNENALNELKARAEHSKEFGGRLQAQSAENCSLKQKIKQIRHERLSVEEECQHLRMQLERQMIAMRSLEKQIQGSEASSKELAEALRLAEDDNQKLGALVSQRRASVQRLEISIRQLQSEIQHQEIQLQKLQQLLARQQAEAQQSKLHLGGELEKAEQLRLQTQNLERQIDFDEREFAEMCDREEMLREREKALARENEFLRGEISRKVANLNLFESRCPR